MSNDRIIYLNGLRGILAVIVFIHHFLYACCPYIVFGSYEQFLSGQWGVSRTFATSPLNIIFNPGMAINFFFLLSGYVQSYHYFKTKDTVFLQRSFLKRYFRLAIPVLAVVILVFIFHKLHLIHKNYFPYNPLTNEWMKSMLPDNLGFFGAVKYALVDTFKGISSYYQVLWTMYPELCNSWLVLILLFVTHQVKNKVPLLLLWILIQVIVLEAYYAVSFTIGVLICNLNNEPGKFIKFFSKPLVKWICLLVGIYFASYPFTGYEHSTEKSVYKPISFFETYPHVLSYAFGNSMMFIAILHSVKIKRLLAKKIMLFFGDISFMFYLSHFLILFSFSAWMYQKLVPHLYTNVNLWLTGTTSFLLITAVSWPLYKYVDSPVVKFCNVYTKRIFGI